VAKTVVRRRPRFWIVGATFAAALVVGVVAIVALAAGAAAAIAGRSTPPPAANFGTGTAVARSSLPAMDRAMLTHIGATGAIVRIGSHSGASFYEIASADGGRCFAFGRLAEGLSGGCLDPAQPTPPVIDMSTISMDPSSGNWSMRTLQGIAADGIAKVQFVDGSGTVHTARVGGNVYRVDGAAWPGGPTSGLRAFDAGGNRVFSESVGGA
jgi:hypothetical protein